MAAKTSAAVKNRWNKENYDRIQIMVSKGKKAMIREHAERMHESMNGFITRAIDEAMKRDVETTKKLL